MWVTEGQYLVTQGQILILWIESKTCDYHLHRNLTVYRVFAVCFCVKARKLCVQTQDVLR